MDNGDGGSPRSGMLDYASRSTKPAARRPRARWYLLFGVLGFILLVLILLSSRGEARPQAVAIACRANLRGVVQAIELYVADNGGAYPDTLGQLHPSYVRDARIFRCSGDMFLFEQGKAPQGTLNDLAAGGHLSYVYAGAGLTTATADANTVLAFEWPGHHPGMKPAGINVLFADGHAQWVADYRPIVDSFAAGVRPVVRAAARGAATTVPSTSRASVTRPGP